MYFTLKNFDSTFGKLTLASLRNKMTSKSYKCMYDKSYLFDNYTAFLFLSQHICKKYGKTLKV